MRIQWKTQQGGGKLQFGKIGENKLFDMIKKSIRRI